jgi:hypothetical protein
MEPRKKFLLRNGFGEEVLKRILVNGGIYYDGQLVEFYGDYDEDAYFDKKHYHVLRSDNHMPNEYMKLINGSKFKVELGSFNYFNFPIKFDSLKLRGSYYGDHITVRKLIPTCVDAIEYAASGRISFDELVLKFGPLRELYEEVIVEFCNSICKDKITFAMKYFHRTLTLNADKIVIKKNVEVIQKIDNYYWICTKNSRLNCYARVIKYKVDGVYEKVY